MGNDSEIHRGEKMDLYFPFITSSPIKEFVMILFAGFVAHESQNKMLICELPLQL